MSNGYVRGFGKAIGGEGGLASSLLKYKELEDTRKRGERETAVEEGKLALDVASREPAIRMKNYEVNQQIARQKELMKRIPLQQITDNLSPRVGQYIKNQLEAFGGIDFKTQTTSKFDMQNTLSQATQTIDSALKHSTIIHDLNILDLKDELMVKNKLIGEAQQKLSIEGDPKKIEKFNQELNLRRKERETIYNSISDQETLKADTIKELEKQRIIKEAKIKTEQVKGIAKIKEEEVKQAGKVRVEEIKARGKKEVTPLTPIAKLHKDLENAIEEKGKNSPLATNLSKKIKIEMSKDPLMSAAVKFIFDDIRYKVKPATEKTIAAIELYKFMKKVVGEYQESGGEVLTPEKAQEFLKQAGGDKEKARELAKSMGFIF